MSRKLLFWILMLLWLVFGLVWPNVGQRELTWALAGPGLLFFILLVVGWQVFGKPVE